MLNDNSERIANLRQQLRWCQPGNPRDAEMAARINAEIHEIETGVVSRRHVSPATDDGWLAQARARAERITL